MKKKEVKKSKAIEVTNLSFDVYTDFIFDDGLFFIMIKNNSSNPVFNVRIKFNSRILGINGSKEITSLNLFKNIEFLAPQKEIKTFLDTSESYFSRKQPTKITTEICYKDIQSKDHQVVIKHDLEIYRDIGFVIKK
jgi:hypothetical protein